MEETPKELDWVAARKACTLGQVMHALANGVEQDIQARREVLTEYQKRERMIGFKLEAHSVESFTVHRSGAGIMSLIQFKVDEGLIKVLDEKREVFLQASIGVNDYGRCMLVVDKKEVEHWQFRKRALEELFFDPKLALNPD